MSNYIQIEECKAKVFCFNTVVVGTGAAGFNAAARLKDAGQNDIAIVTEGIKAGTSRNTGSDKQTYYKLTLSGDVADSVADMAQDLFNGQCVDGDIAMAEAAMSVQCFLHLCELGVAFPVNRYGEYVGYKTDHDPRTRATSAGPLTSKLMTEALEKEVLNKEIQIFDKHQVISVLTNNDEVLGLLALDLKNLQDKEKRFVFFHCKNIVYATGGPAGIYANSVYPAGHWGSSGIAFSAGVKGRNLTEWQYGLASVRPRWNVSGTYMQVLPRFVSIDENGNEYEFLNDYFDTKGKLLSAVFKKGYEWPFDCKKVQNGSSFIDLLVYKEMKKNRKVYLDFTKNPFNEEINFSKLDEEAFSYLNSAESCFGTPIERLIFMNMPAYELYLSKGVDLKKDILEIALCAQHNNGGLEIDMWWQSNIKGFFPVGEAAGSHGIYRPGGSALNAGQVGSLRAAKYIAAHRNGDLVFNLEFEKTAKIELEKQIKDFNNSKSGTENVKEYLNELTKDMSIIGGAVRDYKKIKEQILKLKKLYINFDKEISLVSETSLPLYYRLKDIVICQLVYLSAMIDYIEQGGKSRGSVIYPELSGMRIPGLEDEFNFTLDNGKLNHRIQNVTYQDGNCVFTWRSVRSLPESGGFFENVWKEYRETGNVF